MQQISQTTFKHLIGNRISIVERNNEEDAFNRFLLVLHISIQNWKLMGGHF